MLRSLWLLFLYLGFLGFGVTTPFIMTLGYVWVDTLRPQDLSMFILNEMPVAMIMGAGAMGAYLALDRRSPPPMNAVTALLIMMCAWMTATLIWAEVPTAAWEKWNWAFKAMAFAAFLPYVIRSRVQIEAFTQTYVFSLAANIIPFGVKVLISGGGYGQNLGLMAGNSGLAESGSLAVVCLMSLPLALYLGKHGLLVPRVPILNWMYPALAILSIVTALGTYERSALIGMIVLAGYMFMRSRRKLLFGLIGGLGAILIIGFTAQSWIERISTIGQYQKDSSALVRVLVWQWTFDYSLSHPLGGSFNSFLVNSVVVPGDEINPGGQIMFGRAFHSIYFEVLGELGWPGIIMFLTVVTLSMLSLRRLSKKTRDNPELAWLSDLSDAVQSGIMVFMSAGAFLGMAFQPILWYFISIGIALNAYLWRAERLNVQPLSGWRAKAEATRMPEGAKSTGWRKPVSIPVEEKARIPGWQTRR